MSRRALALLLAAAAGTAAEEAALRDIPRLADGAPHHGHFPVAPDYALPFRFESTEQGNGVLYTGGLALRVYDVHDDGVVFAGRFLEVATVDLDGKGLAGLLVTGTLLLTGEQGEGTAIPRPVLCLYRWDAKQERFVAVIERNAESVRLPTGE